AGRAPGVGRRRREERATIWQRGCRRAPPDRSPQPPWLLGQPPSPRGRVPLERGLPLDRPGVGRLHSWSVTRAAHLLTGPDGKPTRDQPWIFRTYAGHTNVRASNALYRGNLSRGQTGLSIAFDLPTQCCYASDHPPAQSELGKVGVPINTLDDFEVLFDAIPIEQINTSMTINA